MSEDNNSTIRDLLSRIKNGDPSAREEFCERIQREGRLSRAVRGSMGPSDPARRIVDTQDILQSAMVAAMRGLDSFRGESDSSLLSWLSTIASRKVGVYRRKAMKTGAIDEPNSLPCERSENGQQTVELREFSERLEEARHKLSPALNVVVELRVRGFETREIAKCLALSCETVRQRDSRATRKLRELLGEEFGQLWAESDS